MRLVRSRSVEPHSRASRSRGPPCLRWPIAGPCQPFWPACLWLLAWLCQSAVRLAHGQSHLIDAPIPAILRSPRPPHSSPICPECLATDHPSGVCFLLCSSLALSHRATRLTPRLFHDTTTPPTTRTPYRYPFPTSNPTSTPTHRPL